MTQRYSYTASALIILRLLSASLGFFVLYYAQADVVSVIFDNPNSTSALPIKLIYQTVLAFVVLVGLVPLLLAIWVAVRFSIGIQASISVIWLVLLFALYGTTDALKLIGVILFPISMVWLVNKGKLPMVEARGITRE